MSFQTDILPIIDTLKDVTFSLGATKLNLYIMLQGLLTITLMLWSLHIVINFVERRLIRMQNLRATSRTLIVKMVQIFLYIIAFLTTLQILGISLAAFSVIGGALGVGIGFGLQKIASNFISGIILLFEKSVEVDDLIELPDGTLGFIRAISARYTRLETTDSRDILIPNEEFITQRVISLTHTNKRARIELRVTVHYDDDVALALTLLCDAARVVDRCLADPAPMAHIAGLSDTGVMLALYFWIDDVIEGGMEPRTQATLAFLASFRAHGIRIPYFIQPGTVAAAL